MEEISAHCGTKLKMEQLGQNRVLAFDFGTEFYVWKGKRFRKITKEIFFFFFLNFFLKQFFPFPILVIFFVVALSHFWNLFLKIFFFSIFRALDAERKFAVSFLTERIALLERESQNSTKNVKKRKNESQTT